MAIDISRVIRKLDEHLNKNDYAAAERHLSYWRNEAETSGDKRALLTLLNEQIGLYRKLSREKEGMEAIEAVLSYPEIREAAKEDADPARAAVTDGTTLVNAATGLKAFGRAKEALPLYEAAKRIYEKWFLPENGTDALSVNVPEQNGPAALKDRTSARMRPDLMRAGTDPRLAGLYNNMALCLMDLSEFDRAEALFRKALSIMAGADQGEAEMAITCCNLADLVAKRSRIFDSLDDVSTAVQYSDRDEISAKKPADSSPAAANPAENVPLTAEEALLAAEDAIGKLLEQAEDLLDSPKLRHDGHYAYVCEKCAPVFGCYGYFPAEQKFAKLAREIYAANNDNEQQ